MQLVLLRFVTLLTLLCLLVRDSSGQQEISVTPNRPGVADPADVTQTGVLEIEYGWERAFRSREFRTLRVAAGLIRFGLTEDVELRLGMDNYLSQRSEDAKGRRSGVGDTSPGFKYRFLKQDELWPTLAFAYEIKVPSASRKKRLGSGRADHNLFFLASKEIFELDWELGYNLGWIGKERKRGFDDVHIWALSFSHPLFGPVGISGEIYGGPRVNRETPAVVSTDWALTYALTSRVIFDLGVDIGLNSSARDITYFAGVTLSLVDLYRFFGLAN